jgi:ABC-type multidrug transport system permease subunit
MFFIIPISVAILLGLYVGWKKDRSNTRPPLAGFMVGGLLVFAFITIIILLLFFILFPIVGF